MISQDQIVFQLKLYISWHIVSAVTAGSPRAFYLFWNTLLWSKMIRWNILYEKYYHFISHTAELNWWSYFKHFAERRYTQISIRSGFCALITKTVQGHMRLNFYNLLSSKDKTKVFPLKCYFKLCLELF